MTLGQETTRRLLLVVLGGITLPAVTAAAICPTAPPLAATSYDNAVSELKEKKSTLLPRRQLRPSARPLNTILEQLKVSDEKGVCILTFIVSDGSLAKNAVAVNKAAVLGGKVGGGTTDGPLTPPGPNAGATSAAAPAPAKANPDGPDKGKVIAGIAGIFKPPTPPNPPLATACPQLPKFSAQTFDAAVAAIRQANLRIRVNRVDRPSAAPLGNLLEAPQQQRGNDGVCTVTLVTSDGSLVPAAKVCPQLPKFSAQTFEAAVAAIQRTNPSVRVNRVDRPSAAPPGTLLGAPQQQVRDGVCIVTLVASDGSLPQVPKDCPQLPKFSAQTFDAAVAAIRQQNLKVRLNRVDSASSAARGTLLRPPTQQRDADGVCTVTLVTSDGTLVRVPDIVGMLRPEAQSTVIAAGLSFDATESVSNARPGSVTTQSPSAGLEVPRATVVRTTVARAPLLPVPSVVGLQSNEARQRLVQFQVELAPDENIRPAGEIVAQDPPAGERRPPGALVKLLASDGSLVEVPAVTGLNVEAAKRRLEDSDLSSSKNDRDDPAEPDTVVEQDPAAKTIVKRGHTTVAITVSQGLVVPSVIDMQVDAARTKLSQFKVSADASESDAPVNRVLKQSPAPETRVAGTTVVTLQVSDGSLVSVPDVRNMRLEAARSALMAAGLAPRLDKGPDEADSTVIAQTPLPLQALVKRNSAVGLEVKAPFPWLLVALGMLTLGAVAAAYAMRTGPQPTITVDAKVEPSPVPPQLDEAERSGPDLRVEARLVPGDTTIELDERVHA